VANADVPQVFARHLATMHVPRRYYAARLPGIPTIRVFEALACGIPLVSAPWADSEGLFRAGHDYLVAENGDQARQHLVALRNDPELRRSLAEHGVEAISTRHTCAHRASELLSILNRMMARSPLEIAA
jgi:spore maturation protein CgeB